MYSKNLEATMDIVLIKMIHAERVFHPNQKWCGVLINIKKINISGIKQIV